MTVESSFVKSTVSGIPSRNVHVYLPPNYNAMAEAGYPVIYMHDGQNVFSPGTEFGCWEAEHVADKEINSGSIPPLIIVAIDNDGDNRNHEYVPPGDHYKDWKRSGEADRYRTFILEDVIPFVTSKYHITDQRSEKVIAGASLGGVVSLYLGLTANTFGMIGSMSTAICWAETFCISIRGRAGKPLRIYHDVGTAESAEMAPDDYTQMPRTLHENLKIAGYREPDDLRFEEEQDALHNEVAWNNRLPEMLRWLFG